MHIRRAAVPASPEPETPSSSLALLPLLSLSVLVFILLFFAIRLFKRSLHLPSLTWLRGKGQGAKRSLGLSGVELLPTSLKPVPTPGPSPYAASFNLEGNAGKGGNTSLLSRSSSLDGFPQFVVTGPPPPTSATSPGRSHSRSPFAFSTLFNSKRKPLHRRSRSLGGPVRDLTPATSLVTGSSAPPTPSTQALLIDFSTSNSSTSTSSDLGTHKFPPGSPPLIPGLPIPTSSPARPFTSKSHTFPASTSHVWTFDQEDDADDSRATDPLLTVFKRSHSTPLAKSQPEPEPLIHYDRSTSPSPFRAPPTPSLAPKRVSTANPFASLASSSSAAYIPQRPLSPSPLSLSPASPPGLELVPVPVPVSVPMRSTSVEVELVSMTHSSPSPRPRALNLVDLDTNEESDDRQGASHHYVDLDSERQETPVVFVPSPSPPPRPTLHQSDTEKRDMDTPPPLPQEAMSAISTCVDLAADPFDDTHAVTLSETERETEMEMEDPWGTHLPPSSDTNMNMDMDMDMDSDRDYDRDRQYAYTHTPPDHAPSAPHSHSPSPVQQPLVPVVVSARSSPIPVLNAIPTSVEAPIPSSPSPTTAAAVATDSPAQDPPKALSTSWQWDDAWSSVPPLPLTQPQHEHEHRSGWPTIQDRAPREGADVEARGMDVTDADADADTDPRGEVEDDLISFERETVARVRGQVGAEAAEDEEMEMEMEMDPADAWFVEEPTAVWDVGGGVVWNGDMDMDVDGKEGKGGVLFGMGKEEDEREVQIRFLDGLLAGPSAPEPAAVDVYVFEEEKAEAKEGNVGKKQQQEPSYEDQDQEDEVYDSNDVHDIDDTTTTTATTTHTAVDTTTSTTTTMRSVLSTPTTPNTPLPSLPSQPLHVLTTTISSIEEHPDPDLLPLPDFLPLSPTPLSPQPLKPHSEPPSKPLSPAQTPTPPASPPPTHHVPAAVVASRPLWSLRAADAPPLGLPAAAAAQPSAASVRGVLEMGLRSEAAEAKPAVEVEADVAVEEGSVQEATAVVVVPEAKPEEKVAVTILVDAPEEEEKKEEDHLHTEPQGLALSTSLPGSFPSSPKTPPPVSLPIPVPVPAPAHLSLLPRAVAAPSTSNSSSSSTAATTTPTSTSTSTSTKTRAVQARSASASNRLRPPRSALDLALAMQLRPGLGAGADPAWMVRFLMVMFGWVAVLISGDV